LFWREAKETAKKCQFLDRLDYLRATNSQMFLRGGSAKVCVRLVVSEFNEFSQNKPPYIKELWSREELKIRRKSVFSQVHGVNLQEIYQTQTTMDAITVISKQSSAHLLVYKGDKARCIRKSKLRETNAVF
jgi:hypothetical protein